MKLDSSDLWRSGSLVSEAAIPWWYVSGCSWLVASPVDWAALLFLGTVTLPAPRPETWTAVRSYFTGRCFSGGQLPLQLPQHGLACL